MNIIEPVLLKNGLISFPNKPIICGVSSTLLGDYSSTSANINLKYHHLLSSVSAKKIYSLKPMHETGLYLTDDENLHVPRSLLVTADAIVHFGDKGRMVSVIHCSHITLGKRIVEIVFEKIYKNSIFRRIKHSDMKALIYPGICRDCYEVRSDVKNKFRKHPNHFKKIDSLEEKKWNMDLSGIIIDKVIRLGVAESSLSLVEICSAHQRLKESSILFSFRARKEMERNMVFAKLPSDNKMIGGISGDCPYLIIYC